MADDLDGRDAPETGQNPGNPPPEVVPINKNHPQTQQNQPVTPSPTTSTSPDPKKLPGSKKSRPLVDGEGKKVPLTVEIANRHGLPATANRLTFDKFITYWKNVPKNKVNSIDVFCYRLFVITDLPVGERAAASWLAGEQLVGPDEGTEDAIEKILNQIGLGDYYFILRVDPGNGAKPVEICRSWLPGYKDNLPGWRDFNAHPPVIQGDPLHVIKWDDERNLKSGYISYLRSKGIGPRIQTEEEKESMAENQTAGSAAIGVLGKLAEKAFDKPEPTPVQVVQKEERKPEWETIRETIATVNNIHRENAINPVDIVKATAELMRPDNSAAIAMQKRMDALLDQISQSKDEEARALREELREMRRTMAEMATRPPVQEVAPVRSEWDELGRELLRKKIMGDDEDEDEPRGRRQRYRDFDDYPAPAPAPTPEPSLMAMIVSNLPALMTAGAAILQNLSSAAHNINVARTGEGQSIPVAAVTPPGMPGMMGGGMGMNPAPGMSPLVPGMMMAPPPGVVPGVQTLFPTPQENPQQKAMKLLDTIAPGFIGSFERDETGYDYAELFIRTVGRAGEFGYAALHDAHMVAELNPQKLPFPQGSVAALSIVLSMHPGIWGKVGADRRLGAFLEQFVTYDEFLHKYEAQNITDLLIPNECRSVREFLSLPEEERGYPMDDDYPEPVEMKPPPPPPEVAVMAPKKKNKKPEVVPGIEPTPA